MKTVKKWMIAVLMCTVFLCAGCGQRVQQTQTQPTTNPTVDTAEPTIQTEETQPPALWVFPEQTVIAGCDVGGMDATQAAVAVNSVINAYVLNATVNDRSVEITAQQINLAVSQEQIIAYGNALAEGQEASVPVPSFDNGLLTEYLESQCQKAAVNAAVRYNAGSDCFEVTKEQNGFSIDVPAAAEQLAPALQSLSAQCQVTVEQKTKKPSIYSNDSRLHSAVASANEYLQISLAYIFAPEQVSSSTQPVTADEIGKMIGFNKDYVPYVSTDAVNRYAASMNDKYAVRARFKTTGGGYISVNTSSISQAVDTDALAADLKSCLETKTGGTRNAPYKPASGAAAIWNGNYVEVDLTRQHLWVYKDGNCVVSTPIVTGCVAQDMETPTGVYSINYKSRNVTLRGPTWNDFVSYWMPFFGNYGLHDASWRSSFGGDIYLYEGSHGCVNIPVAAAGQVYANVSAGTKVILYGGVTDVKLEQRQFSGKTQYSVTPETAPFSLDITSEDAPTLSYASDAPNVAEVAEDGTVTVKGVGTANITVSAPAHGRHSAGFVTVKITVAYDCSAGHTFTWTTVKEPSCEWGSQMGVCKCGFSENRALNPVKEHTYGEWVIKEDPTCEHSGEKACQCQECGMVKTETISSIGHDYSGGETCANCGQAKPTPPPEAPTEPETEPTLPPEESTDPTEST